MKSLRGSRDDDRMHKLLKVWKATSCSEKLVNLAQQPTAFSPLPFSVPSRASGFLTSGPHGLPLSLHCFFSGSAAPTGRDDGSLSQSSSWRQLCSLKATKAPGGFLSSLLANGLANGGPCPTCPARRALGCRSFAEPAESASSQAPACRTKASRRAPGFPAYPAELS